MRSLAAFILWGTLLIIPCWFWSLSWQQMHWSLVRVLLEATGVEQVSVHLVRFAPYDMALFAAMCLASARVSMRQRIRALLIGIPSLAVVEFAALIAAVSIAQTADYFGAEAGLAKRLVVIPAYTALYVIPAIAWALLLGRSYLPALEHSDISSPGRVSGTRGRALPGPAPHRSGQ